jgi:hypothetical protein
MADEEKMTVDDAKAALDIAVKNYNDALMAEVLAVGAVIPESVMNSIITYVNNIKSLFGPYETSLTPADRKRLISTRYKNFGFIEQAYASAASNPSLVPPYINITTFKNDFDDFERKRNIEEIVNQLVMRLSDSSLAASDIAYRHALGYYNSVKEAARQHVPGAEAAYESMKKYFKRKKSSSDEPTEMEIERDVRSLLRGTKDGRVIIENERPVTIQGKRRVVDEVHSEHSVSKDSIEKDTKE